MGLNKKIALSIAASRAIDASDKRGKSDRNRSWLKKATQKVKGAFHANSQNRKR